MGELTVVVVYFDNFEQVDLDFLPDAMNFFVEKSRFRSLGRLKGNF